MLKSSDEVAFRRATGLDLQQLVARHIGKDSEEQIFEWIRLVLGRQYFQVAEGCYVIHTLEGWREYCRDMGFTEALMEVVVDNSSDAPLPPQ